MRSDVNLRPVQLPGDVAFLKAVFASTRVPELTALAAAGVDGEAFVGSQFDAQSRYIHSAFGQADEYVVMVGDDPAGRLVVNRSSDELRIIDLALLPAFRGAGIGTALVEHLLAEATARGTPVRCQVLEGSESQPFWEGAGFVATGREGARLLMERACTASTGRARGAGPQLR